ncbi:ornithine cyclodeaminase family protein (plasmid) [Rhizobium sp. CB3090]|uniref:ornithine cyclodeaminase family protein n=1 Tax=Rhizobium sp. CB3090 TaxID=3039156 RepID=UPI0024B0BC52|nr:ornithine cyclodeaminase family protein [Rhizobium sp. CB3090]WFU12816.1 ornithine cyclodeaminase family protein [Rhizobium sp. CB3090]
MRSTTILTERQLRKLVSLDLEAIGCVDEAFQTLATKKVVMPPILLSSKTGLVQALLLDNGYLTDIRTAAAGAVAARHLARKEATVAAVFGAGMQARLQLQALTLVRSVREARVWARDNSRAEKTAGQLSLLGIRVPVCHSREEAVAGAHVIIITTPADHPILEAHWLEPGQHVTAMGSDAEYKNEIEPQAIARADLYVADSLSQTRLLGELHHAIAVGAVGEDHSFPELGQIAAGTIAGRTNDNQITIADLTGAGIQDTAIANLAFARALAAKAGTRIE